MGQHDAIHKHFSPRRPRLFRNFASSGLDSARSSFIYRRASSRALWRLRIGRGRLDHAITNGIDFDDGLLDQLDRLDAEIATTQASTLEGLCMKARAACWALLGDLDDPGTYVVEKGQTTRVSGLMRLR